MENSYVNALGRIPVSKQPLEIVERKGLGHPDSICDAIMNDMSVALCKAYLETYDTILHHNMDKALLGAGKIQAKFGGGKIIEPMKYVIGDRATRYAGDKEIDVWSVCTKTGSPITLWVRSLYSTRKNWITSMTWSTGKMFGSASKK